MRPTRALWISGLLACLTYASAAGSVASHASATSDEVPHIAAGLYYLRGDWRLNPEHPPLIKLLAASRLPGREQLRPLPEVLPTPEIQWDLGRDYLYRIRREPPLALLLRARAPIIALDTLLIVALAAGVGWAIGPVAGAVAAWAAALCPLWLAHSTLVTTDGAASAFFFASCVLAGWLLHAEGRRQRLTAALGLTLALALALASKYSMLSALGLVPLAAALDARRLGRSPAIGWVCSAALGGALLGIGCAWGWPPQPGLYLHGVGQVGHNHRSDAFPFYAFGELFTGQDPLYFARALLVKVSLPVLLLALGGLFFALQRRRAAQAVPAPRLLFVWLIPPLGYYALMAWKAPAIGVRYVLPVLPFLFVAAGSAAEQLWRLRRARWLILPLSAAHAASLAVALAASPLAFFNGLFCSTGDRPPCLDDSNVDWGQSLPQLAQARDRLYPGSPLRLFYFGSSPPGAYVRDASLAEVRELLEPQPALYAISLHLLTRMPEQAWPHARRPQAVVGGAYALYDLRSAAAPTSQR